MGSLPILLKTQEFDFLRFGPNETQAKEIRRAMCPGPYLDAIRQIIGIQGDFFGGYSWTDKEDKYATTEFRIWTAESEENIAMLEREGVYLEQTISAEFAKSLDSLVTIGIGLRAKDDMRSLNDDFNSKYMPYHMAINVHFQSTFLEEDPIIIGKLFNGAPEAILTLARNHSLIRLGRIYEEMLQNNEDLEVQYLKSLHDVQEIYTQEILPRILEERSVEVVERRVKEFVRNHYT